jgi:hypothetical protein
MVKARSISYLARNQRDMGYSGFAGKLGISIEIRCTTVPTISSAFARQQQQQH